MLKIENVLLPALGPGSIELFGVRASVRLSYSESASGFGDLFFIGPLPSPGVLPGLSALGLRRLPIFFLSR